MLHLFQIGERGKNKTSIDFADFLTDYVRLRGNFFTLYTQILDI